MSARKAPESLGAMPLDAFGAENKYTWNKHDDDDDDDDDDDYDDDGAHRRRHHHHRS